MTVQLRDVHQRFITFMINAPVRTRVAVVGMSVLLVSALSPAFAATQNETINLAADRAPNETASRSHAVPLPAGETVPTPQSQALTVAGVGSADGSIAAAAAPVLVAPVTTAVSTVLPSAPKAVPSVPRTSTPTTSSSKVLSVAPSASSGSSMPNGDLPGWNYVYGEDFNTSANSSSVDGTYANSYCGYADGTGGVFFKSPISVHDGSMDWTLDGKHGAAGTFGPASTCWGKTYGRYSIRYKAEGASNYAAAFMIWPTSDVWGDGELDFPEGNLDQTFNVFHHGLGCSDCSASDSTATGVSYKDWHTATTEWLPNSVKYYVDGKLIKTVTHDIPKTAHRMTVQVIPNSGATAGHLYIDWVAQWNPA